MRWYLVVLICVFLKGNDDKDFFICCQPFVFLLQLGIYSVHCKLFSFFQDVPLVHILMKFHTQTHAHKHSQCKPEPLSTTTESDLLTWLPLGITRCSLSVTSPYPRSLFLCKCSLFPACSMFSYEVSHAVTVALVHSSLFWEISYYMNVSLCIFCFLTSGNINPFCYAVISGPVCVQQGTDVPISSLDSMTWQNVMLCS